jgi:hypothetical protein
MTKISAFTTVVLMVMEVSIMYSAGLARLHEGIYMKVMGWFLPGDERQECV